MDAGGSQQGWVGAMFSGAVTRFLALLPAMVVAALCLRGWGLLAGVPDGGFPDAPTPRLVAMASGFDLLVFAKYLPVLFLLSWPWLLIRRTPIRLVAVGAFWSLLLALQIALEQFYLVAGMPLGAELFGYSWQEIRTTVSAGVRVDALTLSGWLGPLAVLWLGIAAQASRAERWRWPTPRLAGGVLMLSLLGLWWLPSRPANGAFTTEAAYGLALNKAAYFVEENAGYLAAHSQRAPGFPDARYPFLRRERTPDVLGEHFEHTSEAPPNLVFILVEGLGRSFSGPRASLGSFTPFLDELAGRSLYWENFLASQGRTFGVLPSVFGSLPPGERGFNALGEAMPRHDDLLAVLKRHGYGLRFYSGSDVGFDNQRLYLQRQGVDTIVGVDDFGPQYPRSPGEASWGYADNELVSRMLAGETAAGRGPFVAVMQTISMHTPYAFPGQAAYRERFERRLDEIGIAEADKPRYRRHENIYASVMYTDDALRRFFDEFSRHPAYANTIFVITGDHRLPEIPIANRIERYHVPLIVSSPLLKRPARIRSVSSHLDIAPSLLAYLSNGYGVATPKMVTWTGSGLDMEPSFRNVHDIALKQSKTILSDFVSGPWLLSRGELFALGDGMTIEPASDSAVSAQIGQRFARYRAANDRFARDRVLAPADGAAKWAGYRVGDRGVTAAPRIADPFGVREVRAPEAAPPGPIDVDVLLANGGTTVSEEFVPLLVLSDEAGRELGEYYGAAIRLTPGARQQVRIAVAAGALAPGRYYLAAIASHPVTGRRVGASRYRIPLQIRG